MNKDVIYIDVEDDITAIIGKVKGSKEKIVALVPPKRVGVLQSAVNLHLLSRAATQNDKHLVLISNNAALSALAAAAKIPVAKNLQSKPELAEIPALDIDDGDDIIDGAQLPVGELARTADQKASADGSTSAAIEAVLSENAAEKPAHALPPAPGQAPGKPRTKSGVKVPNFSTFRKKVVLIAGGVLVLIAFFVWAIFFAPHATVIISARTTDASANAKVNLVSDGTTSLTTSTIKTTSKQQKQDANLSFDATGKKEVGEKATGTVSLSKQSLNPTVVPAGSQLTTSSGLVFTTNSDATIPASTVGGSCFPTACAGSVTVGVTAAAAGTKYNGASGSMGGAPSSASASLTSTTSGGTDKTITVVTAEDVQKANEQLATQNNDSIKKQLNDQLKTSSVVLDATFKADRSQVQPSPVVGEEASGGKAKLAGSVTYSLMGVNKSEVSHYLDDYFAKQLEGKDEQRVYDNGKDKATFTNVTEVQGGFSANIVANAKVGPKINDDAIKNAAKGKRYGDIQSNIESIPGVDNVDVKFSPFWVNSAPNDVKRISVEFNLNESK
ncbi:MAG TPA: baseplate J/gp47 family protein [Candidatus Saccharimonadales bacterium]|nr:baseplate J/gp47 family protein [Candidatus Saccharimonadales bacterium]